MGGLLGAIDIHYPFFAAGTLALVNLVYGYFVLPESLPPERRNKASMRSLNPVAALMHLGSLKGVGGLIAVSGLCTLAQFVLHTSWVLYTGLRFEWGPRENGWSLFTVGVASAIVQGMLLQRLLKRFGATRLAAIGLVSSTLANLAWALATEGWMMYAVIGFNLFGFTVAAAIQSIVSNAADPRTQGQTMGAMAALTSLTAVIAPVIGAPLLGLVSHLPRNDWRVGAPFFFCSAVLAVATVVAIRHFSRQTLLTTPAASTSAG
jgi:DHA1 family tetracycline resistance protein-like MFS transporter